MRIPWLMHAAARGETGRDDELAGALLWVALTAAADAAALPSATAADFASSFFHIRHLDIEKEFSKSLVRRAGREAATLKSEHITALIRCKQE
jgi:hypothetical protein